MKFESFSSAFICPSFGNSIFGFPLPLRIMAVPGRPRPHADGAEVSVSVHSGGPLGGGFRARLLSAAFNN